MADFHGHAVLPGIGLASQNQSATHAGAEAEVDQAAARRRRQPEFSVGGNERVVFHDNRTVDRVTEIACQVDIAQARQIGSLGNHATGRIDESREADTDATRLRVQREYRAQGAGDGGNDRAPGRLRGFGAADTAEIRVAALLVDDALVFDHAHAKVGAADIDAYPLRHVPSIDYVRVLPG